MKGFCQVQWRLGQTEYGQALKLQKELTVQRMADQIPDTLLLMEHPHTFTVGIHGHRHQLLVDQEELTRLNIAYYEVDRGGSVSYHGPGQFVCYPILKLQDYGYNYHQYIARLESTIIRALGGFNIHAFRQPGQRGVWVLPRNGYRHSPGWGMGGEHPARIGTIGVKVNKQQITNYGFTINVNLDLEYYDLIIPRGIESCHITSLQQVLRQPVEIGDVVEPVIQSFCELFELEPVIGGYTPLFSDAILATPVHIVS